MGDVTGTPQEEPIADRGGGDDLTAIVGIGPAASRALADAGIRTYAQLGDTSERLLATIVKARSEERIRKEDWRGQAAALAAAAPLADRPVAQTDAGGLEKGGLDGVGRSRHSFTLSIEVEGGLPRRYTIKHAPSESTESGPGWDPEKVVAFIEQCASLSHEPRQGRADDAGELVTGQDAVTEGPSLPPLVFDSVRIEHQQPLAPGEVDVVVEFGADPALLRRASEVSIIVVARPRPFGKSIEVGRLRRTLTRGHEQELAVHCLVPEGMVAPSSLLALIEVFATGGDIPVTKHGLSRARAFIRSDPGASVAVPVGGNGSATPDPFARSHR